MLMHACNQGIFRDDLHNQGSAELVSLANRTCKSSKAVLAMTLMGDNQRITTNLVINRVSMDLDPNVCLFVAERMLWRNLKALFRLIFGALLRGLRRECRP
jgi:hypothetical protein